MTGKEQIIHLGKHFYGEKFNLDDTKRAKMYENLYYYFLKSSQCPYDLNKGIALVGSIGVGKSSCLRIFQRLFSKFQIANTQEVLNHFYKNGIKGVIQDYGYDRKVDLCIDDFGIDRGTNNEYGNRVELFHELYVQRYELYVRENFKFHFTSNLVPSDLREMLGDRLYDRLKETNNLITWEGKSLR